MPRYIVSATRTTFYWKGERHEEGAVVVLAADEAAPYVEAGVLTPVSPPPAKKDA